MGGKGLFAAASGLRGIGRDISIPRCFIARPNGVRLTLGSCPSCNCVPHPPADTRHKNASRSNLTAASGTAQSPPAPRPPAPAAARLAQAIYRSAPPNQLPHSGQCSAERSVHTPLTASPLLPGSAASPANPHPLQQNRIFRVSCSYSVRLILSRLLTDYETGQITCYKPGQFICSLHDVKKWLTVSTHRVYCL